MVSTSARVLLAGTVFAISAILTLRYLMKKTRKKTEKSQEKNNEEDDTLIKLPTSISGQHDDHTHKDIHIHGKRKHPNEDFINVDVQSPKKPHEMPKSKPIAKDESENLEFFRKELQKFLSEGVENTDKNTNQNAESKDDTLKEESETRKDDNTKKVAKHEVNNGLEGNKEVFSGEIIESKRSQTLSSTPRIVISGSELKIPNQNGSTPDERKINASGKSSEEKEGTGSDDDQSYTRFSEEEITDALLVSQTSPGILSGSNAEVLSSLLTHPDPKLQETALNGINRCSTFTRNQNLFREHGCLSRLSNLLYQQRMSRSANPKLVTSVANAITNLSSNEENHKKLEDCVSTLIDLTLEDETGESVCLSSLKALTNLSITSQHHGHYTRVVQRLYDLVDTGAASIKLQAAKVLVNLSCNPELVPHMLAAKAPVCLIELLKQGTEEELMLRWTTLLANILTTAKEQKLTSASLPADDKAPSPETMYTALYGVSSGQLKSKVYLLSRHKNENISHQASKIYQVITK
ncbi:armadillo repeat-containing X-linked protein 4-like isoform X1 [Mytilus californianus]|uniref:armadillo repeat-containing X-linked protein 4-like isoform X1 n=1 Tax=Mytilus californianus TaxID=6549 RepID=UPI00224684CB|nr:armadillo repeat-containing X-linked protein 4-like isoform X1 [Mytilus californianus]